MQIPFRIKLLTSTAKAPHKNCESDLWDLFADNFESPAFKNNEWLLDEQATIYPQSRILVRTGIALELPKQYGYYEPSLDKFSDNYWLFEDGIDEKASFDITAYAVADLRPRSGLALKHGITILNSPATIDNSYRKEIGVILINQGNQSYTINKGDKIAQMLIRPLYPSKFEIVDNFEDTGRGGYGSTGK